MNAKTGSNLRWSVIIGYIGILGLMLSCATIGLGTSNLAQGILQLDDGVVEVQNEAGDWEPLAGESTFELVGNLDGLDPLQVAGRTMQTNASTQIANGLDVGDLVHVRGAVLEDDTWLAYSVEPAEQETDQTITIIGRVTSTDPWVVNNITLNITGDTVITGDIKPGTLVKVDVLLLDDGTWEVISISPLGDLTPNGECVNVIATVVSVNGNQVQFLGWPTTVTFDDTIKTDDDDVNENDGSDNDENDDLTTLQPGQQVLAVVCVSDDGQLVIVKVTVLDDDDGDTSNGGGEKVLVCHKPDKKGGNTISIASPAVPAHLAHGDKLGACPSGK